MLQTQIYSLFKNLGIDISSYYVNGNHIRGVCPCHESSDNLTAFTYYFDKGLWFCWTHGCERVNGKDLVGFIASKKKINPVAAYRFARKFIQNYDVNSAEVNVRLQQAQTKDRKADYWKQHLQQKSFSESTLKNLRSPAIFARERQLDLKIFERMGAGFATTGKMKNRVVLPVRNIEKKIVGFTGRLTVSSKKYPKWIHLPKDCFKTRINLFNIDSAARFIRQTGVVIVGEGPFETIKFEMAGYKTSIATFGLNISSAQIEIFKKCGTIYVVLAFDPDRIDSPVIKNNISRLQKHDFDVRLLRWEGEEDIGAMKISKLHNVMSQVNDIPNLRRK